MDELSLLHQIAARARDLPALFPHILAGPGHDCAAVAINGSTLLLKADQLIERRHFTPDTPPDLIARKALARTLSDIAAAAGTPLAALVTAAIPPADPRGPALAEALDRWGRHWRCPLIGGDLAQQPTATSPLALSVTILAAAHATRGPVLRSGTRPNDLVCVTGQLGGSLAADGTGRHLTFEPRLTEARWLADTLGTHLHAMMDLSDGLGLDSARLADMSSVALHLDSSTIPIHADVAPPRAQRRADQPPAPPLAAHLHHALADGEDYELLFTCDPATPPPETTPTGVPITIIGTAAAGTGSHLRLPTGELLPIAHLGYRHTSTNT